MDFFKKAMANQEAPPGPSTDNAPVKSGGMFDRLSNKMNAAAGGGATSEKNEDALDKGIDFFQQHILKQGPQNNESAYEQAKDERISDALRQGYKSVTGTEMPIKDKPTTFG